MGIWSSLFNSSKLTAQARSDAYRKLAKDLARHDSWQNVKNGLGTARDRSFHDEFEFEPVSDEEAKQLWRGDAIAARIIEVKPRETYRRGVKLKMKDEEVAKKATTRMEELKVLSRFRKAREYANAYGGGAVFPVINDGASNFAKPLNLQTVSSIKCLQVFEPRELRVVSYYNSITDEDYRRPELYQLVPIHPGGAMGGMQLIHASRLIIFPGTRVSEDQTDGTHPGWGDSALCRPKRVIADYGMSWRAACSLLDNFAQGVLAMDGFTELLATDRDDLVLKRLLELDTMKSSLRTLVIDGKDKFSREQTPLTGLTDVMRELGVYLSMTADMPVTFLLGISPAGMNATGDSDTRSFYDRIDGERTTLDLPLLERMLKLIFLERDGVTKGREPDEYNLEFLPLYQPTEKEAAETGYIVAQTDWGNIDKQIYTANEARSRYQGDSFSTSLRVEGDLPDAPTETDIADIAAAREEARARKEGKAPPVVAPEQPPNEGEPGDEKPTDVKAEAG